MGHAPKFIMGQTCYPGHKCCTANFPTYTYEMSRFFPIDKGPRELKTEDLLKLKTVAEGWYCEYKREMVKTAAIAKSVSAFANTYGGWIFYGIEEDRTTRCANSAPGIPITDIAQAEVKLRQAVSGAINPSPYYEHVILRGPLPELALSEDHAILAVFVPEGVNAPYLHSSGRIYRRVADESDPKEETDRHLLDRLFRRSRDQRKKIQKAISKQPERSAAENYAPCLRLLIFTDLWDENDEIPLSFSRFKEIMSTGNSAFDNFYTTTFGHIARLTFGNDPSKIIYSWHHKRWHEEVVLPFSWFNITDEGLPYPQYEDFETGREFLSKCRASRLESRPVIEISGLFLSLVNICQKLEDILDETTLASRLYFKIQLSGIWRTVPFIDLPLYLQFLGANGVPVAQEDVAYGPPGSGVESLATLRARRRNEIDFSGDQDQRMTAAVLNAITIYREVCRCLGVPAEAVGLDATSIEDVAIKFEALLNAASRSTSISTRHLGIDLPR
jgi:Putative DNA-binding domain